MEIEAPQEDALNDDMYQVDHFSDDIDFSVIENDEKNIQATSEENVKLEVKVPEPVTIQSAPGDAKSKAVVKSSVFENIRPHWENGFSMEDDDDAELLSVVTDEVKPVDEKQVRESFCIQHDFISNFKTTIFIDLK